LSTVELQAYFNSLQPKLSPKTIRLIHGTLRAALNQGIAWGMLSKNPAVGVKLPRKHASASRLRCWDFRLDRHGDPSRMSAKARINGITEAHSKAG